ncbi:MAG: MdtA/MuxA family multidrug efflux RND transporter periplasmic adaptor subunit [Betaproteobacteria bacterium]|uniref:MdtA/MuxA family multidrug efflux RND transporter periplasmic adaptor subunit n=1 Tax=Ferrovum sp. PN-J185 TaxID=1356306 RepID=UPI000792EC7E|nr:MdtA/MuxA family multidrug efflux RND transporter periplasmic adaptor subunit [Ferrovum sp. PN-J185]KXW56753.1 multidrug resistance protein MdtA precursor [Ferrovum sp. PN-J185]MDE1891321.1 MdtA/MuxA family multidrug efflux RND transporter periplasmic adaptor subunit [Betaproteobacteria bacterium]MDE2056153.1 MdtA/MuxA family multidrug efflux RND transporter periplasmic adaptor subunit [Betaproteobacteria bacterium]
MKPVLYLKTLSTKRKIILSIVILFVVWGYVHHKRKLANEAAQQHIRPIPPVVVAKTVQRDFPVWVTGLGTVTPVYNVTIRSRVDGEIVKIYFKEGDIVKKGDPLIDIDPRPYQVQLEQAQGQLEHDQALLNNAKLDLKRYTVLSAKGAIPKQQLDTQKYLVIQYEGTVLTDKSQVDNAKLQLTYSHITAPVTGRLGLRLVDLGNIIHAADTNGMVALTQLDPITVIFPLPQDIIPKVMLRLNSKQLIPVQVWNRNNTQFITDGSLITVDNLVDTTTGMVKLRANFDNKDYKLFPNEFVNARILIETIPNANVVPAASIQQGNSGPYVYVYHENNKTVSVQKVSVGPTNDKDTVVLSGLKPGDIVVKDGIDNLREGAQVKVANSL